MQKMKTKLNNLLACMKFEFIIGIISVHCLYQAVAEITQKLQGDTIVIINVYENINTCIADMYRLRNATN